MIKIQLPDGRVQKWYGLTIIDGKIISPVGGYDGNAQIGARFFTLHAGEVSEIRDLPNGAKEVILSDGVQLLAKPEGAGRKRTEKPAGAATVPALDPVPAAVPAPNPQPVDNVDQTAAAIAAALKSLQVSGKADEATIAAAVDARLAQLLASEPERVKLAAKKAADNGKKEYYCDNFNEIVEDVADGYCVYMHGPAGSGKSHTAQQVAARLGLDLVELNQMEFAHQVTGYGDAAGNYVETPAYKAVTEGKLLFLDEFDRSATQVTTVINTLLANGYFDFPVVGNVKAHPNFRCIAAGNTTMNGAENGYLAASEIDSSTKDRFIFYNVGYQHELELEVIANGDADTLAFVEDVRRAVAAVGLCHVVGYRATKYMSDRAAKGRALESILVRKTFAGLTVDDLRLIYGALSNKRSKWAKAMKKIAEINENEENEN